nr:lactadherin-like [Pocillopora verrucosa]
MTASSFYNKRYYPYYGRLHENRGCGGWCPKTVSDRTDYLQVDMGTMLSVCAVATQGEKVYHEWTTSYKLHLSTNGVTWNVYEETSTAKVFPGNSDRHRVVKHFLTTDVMARYVRFYPVTYHRFPCLRVELFVRK